MPPPRATTPTPARADCKLGISRKPPMRLMHVSVSSLFILLNACSSNEQGTDADTTADTESATSAGQATNDVDPGAVNPNDDTTTTASTTSGNTMTTTPDV